MTFLKKLRNMEAAETLTEATERPAATHHGASHKDKKIGYTFKKNYVQEPRYEGGNEVHVEEEHKIINRLHDEKTVEKIFKKHVTLRDYLKAVAWRLKQ